LAAAAAGFTGAFAAGAAFFGGVWLSAMRGLETMRRAARPTAPKISANLFVRIIITPWKRLRMERDAGPMKIVGI
jgi:hypothetical protein